MDSSIIKFSLRVLYFRDYTQLSSTWCIPAAERLSMGKEREISFYINLVWMRKGGKEVEYIFPIGMKNIGQHKIIICFSMVKKLFLEISQNSQEKSCARVSFSIKLQAWGSYRTSPGDCFSLCFNHFQKKQMTVT